MSFSEPTWRVYLAEWLTVWTSDATSTRGLLECRDHFARKYEGRVRTRDWRAVPVSPGWGNPPYCLQLRLPNLHGEFKDYSDAVQTASELLDDRGGSAHVVQRSSPEERELLDYGKKMLKS